MNFSLSAAITLSSMAKPCVVCPVLQSAAPSSASMRRASVSSPSRRHTSTSSRDRWSHLVESCCMRAV
ncbi:MAG: hypothetical protein IJ551_07420 [Prevotella sp.]|nr:hypothetical protein [Prevotella sp.]